METNSEFQESTLYYYTDLMNNRPDCGRGECVRLLLIDAGIDFEYKRIPLGKWPNIKKELVNEGKHIPCLPYVVTKSGKFYDRVAPLMKRIARDVGKYIPSDSDDEYLADAYSDVYLDWRSKWVNCFYEQKDEKDEQDKNGKVKWVQKFYAEADVEQAKYKYARELESQYSNWNSILGEKGGPYVLGQKITFVDFELYSILREDDELNKNIRSYPNIAEFIEAFEARPSLEAYFVSTRKLIED